MVVFTKNLKSIIKNSWSEDYGDEGFIKVKRGNCGLRSRIAVALCEKFGEMDPVPKATGHLIATHASHG